MDDRDTMEVIHVGSKRKGDELIEPPAKKQKLISASSDEIISQALPEIPIECWEQIISFVSCNLPVAIFFVSRQWRKIYCRLLNRQISLDLDLPLRDAARFPKKVKRIYSKIDIYVLIERAISAAKSKDWSLLLEVSSQLQSLSNMFVYLPLMNTNDYNNDYLYRVHPYFNERLEEKKLNELRAKYCIAVVYTSMTSQEAALRDGTDSEARCRWEFSTFTFFGSLGHYIEAEFRSCAGHDHSNMFDWYKTNFNVTLKSLDSEDSQQFNLSSDLNNEAYHVSEMWSKESVQQIMNWLGITDVDPKKFSALFPSKSPDTASFSLSKAGYELDYIRKWNGQIGPELERILAMFLNADEGWAEEMEFVTNHIKIKSILINRAKETKFSTELAHDEFFALFTERSQMIISEFTIFDPKSIEPCSTVQERYQLEFYNKGAKVQFLMELDLSHRDRFIYLKIPALDLETKLTKDGFDVHLRNVIEMLELKHVTVEDLREVLDKLNPPLASYGVTVEDN
eukprot:TRINITY_DN2137_c0_g1_i4.p1 TRINITY_DN2137_c0_g1~~TRINITY_DN2137_c0_g1_i4.p1  ORF type:complete len:511 (-),score=31.72 TRINITY_DN2137_c0_g1_i4:156-1688(-)